MKKWCAGILLLAALMGFACCALSEEIRYQDGVYRGFYYSEGKEQVAVQFELKDGKFVSVVLRTLNNRWGSLLQEDASALQKEKLSHFNILCSYLVDKEVAAIDDLYEPETILEQAGVTPSPDVPYAKLLSALWDGVNHRPYKLVDTSKLPEAAPYPDGEYTGVYSDDDGEQVVLEFSLQGNCIRDIRYVKLAYKDVDYLAADASDTVKKMAEQFEQLIAYLDGKPLSSVNDLYLPGNIAEDTDVSSAATLRAPKIISAIWQALNKDLYIVH